MSDFSSRQGIIYGAKSVYALYAVLGARLDTVGVWVPIDDPPASETKLMPD